MISVTVTTDNAAFRHDDGTLNRDEAARVLTEAAEKIRDGADTGTVLDYNGNAVAAFHVTED